jgi:regulator of sigma E protease
MSWLLAFVGFALLIILHEFGHFMAAKAVGMRVERFSLFFPPLLARKKVGETEYAIGAIPLGGYVKITGMNPDEDLPDEVRTRAYTAQPVWKRIVTIAAGPAMNLILAFLLLLCFFWLVGARDQTNQVGRVDPDFPAAGVLQPEDTLVAVDGKRGGPGTLATQVARHECEGRPRDGCRAATPAKLLVERDGKRRTIELTPVYDGTSGIERTRLGFSYAEGPRITLPFGEAFTTTADRFWYVTKVTASLPARIFDPEQRKEISGVVGSYEVTRQTIVDDLADVLPILALISLSLAIVNLFPFLPLDGGHIFWAVVEKVRRRPVSYATMERAGVVGVVLVLMLFAIGFSNDLGRITSGEGFRPR